MIDGITKNRTIIRRNRQDIAEKDDLVAHRPQGIGQVVGNVLIEKDVTTASS